jgi:beta-galactosidase
MRLNYLNGKSLGKKKVSSVQLRWDEVVYQPGEIKVVAYKNGVKWAEDKMVTTGKASQLSASADHSTIRPDGSDLVFITVRIEDKNKLMVPRSSNLINFSIAGGRSCFDNGDATCHDPFQSPSRKAYNGMCLIIVKAEKGATGQFVVRSDSKGLKGSAATISIVQ